MHTQTSFLSMALLLAGSAISAPLGASDTTLAAKLASGTMSASHAVSLTSGTNVVAAAASSSTPATSCSSTTPNPSLYAQLLLAPSAVERQALLSDDDYVFNFDDPCRTTSAQGVVSGLGGKTVRADHATFPALVSSGGSVTIGFLGPCGFNTPHVHPRAAELNLVVEGTLFASVTAENGARHINHTLNKWEMTVFPAGAMHTEFNPDCTDAVFVASFPSEDPGVGQIAQEYFGLEGEIVRGSVGGEVAVDGADVEAFRSRIPVNVVKGVESCLAKCGIAKR